MIEKPDATRHEKDPSPVRREGNRIFVTGNSVEAKRAFYKVLENGSVVSLSRDEYSERFPASDLAHFEGTIYPTEEGKMIDGAVVYVNRDNFYIAGEDYTDLIPIVLRHEFAELWTYVRAGMSFSPPPKFTDAENRTTYTHELALREEFKYAFELGLAERYLTFIEKAYPDSIPENEKGLAENRRVYNLIKSRIKRDTKNI